jgi:hypothetical protein
MSYKIEKLVRENYDFNSLFPEKQEETRLATRVSFKLGEIVDFLRKQTNDFRDEFPLAKDLDNAIFRIYQRAVPDKEEIIIPQVTPQERKIPSKESMEKQIKALTILAERRGLESAKKQIKVFKMLINKYYKD